MPCSTVVKAFITVLWPQAEVKVYLSADPDARAERRAAEDVEDHVHRLAHGVAEAGGVHLSEATRVNLRSMGISVAGQEELA